MDYPLTRTRKAKETAWIKRLCKVFPYDLKYKTGEEYCLHVTDIVR